MSLLHALDPGASPSRPGCEARGCRSTFTTSVRAYLGRIHPTTIRVCETHRRGLEVIGDLENPVSCLIPECGRTRATPSRLCADHDRIVVAAGIRIPKTGVIGAETLVKVRKAVEADQDKRAAAHFETLVAAASPAQSATAVQLKADDACMAEFSSSIGGMQFAADLIMAALNGRLAEMPAGVELSLQVALTGVVGLLASERGAVAQRDTLEQTIQAIDEALDGDGAPLVDGKKVKTIADRVDALVGRWQDEIRETICAVVPAPDRIDGGACDSGDPLDLTLAEVAQGLTQLQEQIDAFKAAPPARPTQDERAPDYMGACWRHLADLVSGGTRIDQAVEQVVADLKRTRSIQRETEERRHRAETLLGDAQYLLTELGAPAGSQREDGTLDASITTRIRLLAARPGDLLRVEAIAARVAVCATHGPQATYDEDCCCQTCGQDLIVCADEHSADMLMAALREAAQPAPTVQPDPLRVQAMPADGLRVAVEWALDEAKAPQAASLTDRIAALAKQRNELCVHLVAIREALNVGPASDSDVRLETPLEELARIVRARTVCMLEERDQRVALAEKVEALKKTLGDPLAPAVKALVAWLDLPTGAALLEQMIRAVAKHTVPPEAAIRALHSEEEMARLILSTPKPFGVPF